VLDTLTRALAGRWGQRLGEGGAAGEEGDPDRG
jgi:hypothetical protein